jgi:Glycosyl hydrolases family 28
MTYLRHLPALLLLSLSATAAQAANFPITSYGAVANDSVYDTGEMQAAVNAASNAGGGTVVVPSGKFIIVSVTMKSNVTIQLDAGAILESTWNAAFFSDPFDWNSAMFRGSGLTNVGFTGSGTIDGLGVTSPQGEEGTRGPHLISLQNCNGLNISGLTLKRAGNYTLHLNGTKNARISGVTINGGYDGLHVRYAENFVVQNFTVLNNTDDGVAGHSNMNFLFDNVTIDGARANGFRWGCDGCTARRITVKNKEGYAIAHFSPSDGGVWAGHTLESNNWTMEDWTIQNCGGFFYYAFGESWQDARPMGSALFNRIYATGLKNATVAVGQSTNRVADLCFQDCSISSAGKAAAGFTWPPYGIYASNANRVQVINSKFWYTNSEDRGVISIADSNTGIVSNVGYKTAGTPVAFYAVNNPSQSGNAAIFAAPTQPARPTYYRIKNRWKGNFLFDAGDRVSYGTGTTTAYQWEIIYVDGIWRQLKNRATGHMMHIENLYDYVQCEVPVDARWSGQWRINMTENVWRNLGNRWQTGNLMHQENQFVFLQHKAAQASWQSAQWQLVPQ